MRGVAGGARLRVWWLAVGECCLDHAPEQRHAPDAREACLSCLLNVGAGDAGRYTACAAPRKQHGFASWRGSGGHNKRLNPTRMKRASHVRCARSRVIRSVRRRLAEQEAQRLAGLSASENWLRVASRAWLSSLVAARVDGGGRGALRVISNVCRLPNKPMHPTRIGAAFKFNLACGRVIGGVMPPRDKRVRSELACGGVRRSRGLNV